MVNRGRGGRPCLPCCLRAPRPSSNGFSGGGPCCSVRVVEVNTPLDAVAGADVTGGNTTAELRNRGFIAFAVDSLAVWIVAVVGLSSPDSTSVSAVLILSAFGTVKSKNKFSNNTSRQKISPYHQ